MLQLQQNLQQLFNCVNHTLRLYLNDESATIDLIFNKNKILINGTDIIVNEDVQEIRHSNFSGTENFTLEKLKV